jgi:histone H3/H4
MPKTEAEEEVSTHIFGRVKKPMIQRMAKAAGIRHVSTNLYDAIRTALHRYVKEQVALVLSHADERKELESAGPASPVIPNKTFVHMVSLVSDGTKLSKPTIQALHAKTEAWWLELFQAVHMVSMHRGANVAQPSDLEVVQRLRTTTGWCSG